MVNKTGDARTDYLIDENAQMIRQLEKLAEDKAAENDRLIKRIIESRAKRLGNENA